MDILCEVFGATRDSKSFLGKGAAEVIALIGVGVRAGPVRRGITNELVEGL